MAKPARSLPIDHKWHDLTQLGAMAKPHIFLDGEYIETTYVRPEYPKVKYHPDFVLNRKEGVEYSFTEIPQTVSSIEEERDLGPEWKDSPAEVGVVTCPDEAHLQEKKRKASAQGANWRAALPNSNPDITEAHLLFLQAQGVEVKTLADVYAFLAGLTSQQMKSFMAEVKTWEAKQGQKSGRKALAQA